MQLRLWLIILFQDLPKKVLLHWSFSWFIFWVYLTLPYALLQVGELSVIHFLYEIPKLIIIGSFCHHFPYKSNVSSQYCYYYFFFSIDLNITYCGFKFLGNPYASSFLNRFLLERFFFIPLSRFLCFSQHRI